MFKLRCEGKHAVKEGDSRFNLGNVDNTTDLNKPISTLTQTALNLKATLANPIFTGTISGITKSMVGLANVDNTTDLILLSLYRL